MGVNCLFARVSSDTDVGPIEIDTTMDTGQLANAPYNRVVDWRTAGRLGASRFGSESRRGLPLHLPAHRARGAPRPDRRWQRELGPLIGSRIGLDLTDRVAIAGEANIGGFGVGRRTTFALGCGALNQDYDHNDFERDVTMHGPILGAAMVL